MKEIRKRRALLESKIYEVQFNNNPRQFDRISAKSVADAKKKMKEFYPTEKITSVELIG